jgi:hypothetical protein
LGGVGGTFVKKGNPTMIITDEKWQEIIAATRASIDRWNASARKHNRPDQFHMEVHRSGEFEVVVTEHRDSRGVGVERKCAMRKTATGEMHPSRTKNVGKNGFQTVMKGGDPKSWARLADKPAAEIVKQLKITDFFMVLGSKLTGVATTTL